MNIMFVQSDKYNPKGLSKKLQCEPSFKPNIMMQNKKCFRFCTISMWQIEYIWVYCKNKQICDIDLVNFVQSS